MKKSIMLVGLMGVGKTSIGRRLAQRLQLPFVDTDAEIEAAAGLTVPEIFARYGEAAFRDGERRVIARLIDGPPQVIATGGGAFMDAAIRALALEHSTAIWLDGDVALLAARAARSGQRPLLDRDDPIGSLRRLAAARNPIYAEAHLRIDCGALRPANVVDLILAALKS